MKEYGLLYYDVPTSNNNMYMKMLRLVRRTCLPVNLSVYMFDWGLKNHIESELTKIGAFNSANVNLIKFDSSSKEQVETIALKQLERIFQDIKSKLSKTISKLNDTEKKIEYLDRITRKLKDYDRALVLYSFTNKIKPSLDILKNVIDTEYKFLRGKTIGGNNGK